MHGQAPLSPALCCALRRLQVVEIASLTEHLLTECDRKDGFGQCGRCSEAVLKDELPSHVRAKDCSRECRRGRPVPDVPQPVPSVLPAPPVLSAPGCGPGRASVRRRRGSALLSVLLRFHGTHSLNLTHLKPFQLPNQRSWQTAVLCATRTSHLERR